VLVRQRPAGVVNAHLWEFPNIEVATGSPALPALLRDHLGLTASHTTPLCTVKHSITRYRITVEAIIVGLANKSARPPGGSRWVAIEKLDQLAFTSAHRKLLHAFVAHRAEPVPAS
jgi:A/G-specific adenine glycosylase